jgi:glutaredoxin
MHVRLATSSHGTGKGTAMTTKNDSWIEIFTTPSCPDCIALKRWFAAHGIPFVERDLRDPAVAEEARRRTGLRIAPITVIYGSAFYGPFAEQVRQIEAALGMQRAA